MQKSKSIRKNHLVWGIFLVFFFSGFSTTHAAKYMVGPLEVHPYLQVSETYESNVFRCKEGGQTATPGICPEDSAFFTVVTPGIQFLLPGRDKRFQLEYRGDFAFYSGFVSWTDFVSEEYMDHNVSGEASFNITPRVNLLIRNRFVDGHDSREISPLKELDKFISNRLETEIVFSPRDDMNFALGFGHTLVDYEDKIATDFRDRKDLIFSGRGKVQIISNTSALFEYIFTKAEYEDPKLPSRNLNNDTHQIQGGISFKVGSRSKGRVTGGFLKKMFEDPSKEDFSTSVFIVALDYTISSDTRLQLKGGREVKEPDWNGTNFYVTTGGSLELSQKLTPSIEGFLSTSYGQDSYFRNQDPSLLKGRSRTDNTYRVKTGVDYSPFPWLNAGFHYIFSSTDSNWFKNQFDFINHAFTAKVAVFY